jgi:hypothetical protein
MTKLAKVVTLKLRTEYIAMQKEISEGKKKKKELLRQRQVLLAKLKPWDDKIKYGHTYLLGTLPKTKYQGDGR